MIHLDSATIGFNVDDIADGDFLFEDSLINGWVQSQLFCTCVGFCAEKTAAGLQHYRHTFSSF